MKLAKILSIKSLSLLLLASTLTGCGSGGGGGSTNSAPTLDKSIIVNPKLSAGDTNDECVYLEPDSLGVTELRCTFNETTHFLADGDKVKSWDIDLTTGIVDADPRNALSVGGLVWLFTGPDCTTPSDAYTKRFPEECGANLPEGASDAQKAELKEFRRLQKEGLPKFTRDKYGFRLTNNSVVVTPSEFIPILKKNERAEFKLAYKVSDGTDSIDRIITIIIKGESSDPSFTSILDGGIAFYPALEDEDNNALPVFISLTQGVFDQDIATEEDLVLEMGKLENIFGSDYRPETIRAVDLKYMKIAGGPDNVEFTVNNNIIKLNTNQFPLAPKVSLELNFKYYIADGDPIASSTGMVERTLKLKIVGSDPNINDPVYFESDLTGTFGPGTDEFFTDELISLNLLSRVADPEGKLVLVSTFNDNGLGKRYGINTSKAVDQGIITIDPQAFYHLKEGEAETLEFDLKYTDREIDSPTRKVIITIKGVNRNILSTNLNPDTNTMAYNADYGFESGAFGGDGGWQFDKHEKGESGVTFSGEADKLRTGNYSLASEAGAMSVLLPPASFPQGELLPKRTYFLRYTAKSSNVWAGINAFLYRNNDQNDKVTPIMSSSPAGTKEWIDHYNFFTLEDDKVSSDTLLALSLGNGSGNAVARDDVEIVEYAYDQTRDLVGGINFEDGSIGKWKVLNAQVKIDKDSALESKLGLSITTQAADSPATIVSFGRDYFPEGAIVKGGKYRIQMDIQHKDWNQADDKFATAIPVRFVNADNPAQKIEKTAFVKNEWAEVSLTYNVDTESTDNMVDWSTLPMQLEMVINAKATEMLIDNIRVYRIP